MTMQTTDRNVYGAQESNGLINGPAYHQARGKVQAVDWTTPGLYVTRLRLLSDPGFPVWDVSYCHGKLNGVDVDVILPFSQVPKRPGIQRFIVEEAKKAGVFAKGLGILSNISTLI